MSVYEEGKSHGRFELRRCLGKCIVLSKCSFPFPYGINATLPFMFPCSASPAPPVPWVSVNNPPHLLSCPRQESWLACFGALPLPFPVFNQTPNPVSSVSSVVFPPSLLLPPLSLWSSSLSLVPPPIYTPPYSQRQLLKLLSLSIFPGYEMSRRGRSLETGSRLAVTRGWG